MNSISKKLQNFKHTQKIWKGKAVAYCKGKWLPLQDEFTPNINSKKKNFEKLWANFKKSKNQIFSKTAQPILMAKIYIIDVLKRFWKEFKNLSRL